ncbi:MAG: hypothetical protein R8M11_09315, partial [Gallionella sp.]
GLLVTGGVRLFEITANTNAVNAKNSYTGANLGANYTVNKWLRLFGSINVTDREGEQSVSSSTIGNLSAAAQHHFEPLTLWGFNYTRYVTGTVSNSSGLSRRDEAASSSSSSSNTQSVSTRLQHSLIGKDIFSLGGSATVSQDLYMATTSQNNPQVQLNHTGTFIKRIRKSMIRLSARDSRDLTGNRVFFQSLSLQGNQRENITRTASLSGYATVRAVRTGFDAGPGSTQTSLTSSATLAYHDPRAFDVLDMLFTSNLRLISSELTGGSAGVNQSGNQGQYSWDNKLRYKIGKLQLEGQVMWEEASASNMLHLLFHARRDF